jgi:outer membrane protein OmpA-like peptidoglycan-associated protein
MRPLDRVPIYFPSMRRLPILALCFIAALAACRKNEEAAPPVAGSTTSAKDTPPVTASVSPAGDTAQQSADMQPSLISFSAGALVVQKPQEYGEGWSAFWLLDGKADTGWATPKDVIAPQTMVVALPEKTELETLSFSNAGADGDLRGAKDIAVEMSDTSATAGFQPIAEVSLRDKADNQRFPVSAKVPGRWLKIVVKSSQGSTEYMELFEVSGYGRQLTQTPFRNASGTYETNYGKFHLLHEGASVTGCYEHSEGLLNGGIEGRVMKFTWRQGKDQGPAIMVFTEDGKQLFGLWWYAGQTESAGGVWNGTKTSDDVGSCPHWSGKSGAQAQMTQELEEFGRTRIYGINFDLDSDRIKSESQPTLDKVLAVLKARPDWKLLVEGHTDSTGGEAHNQQLSRKRADAVKAYLLAGGIDGQRLTTAGLGATKPVAGNDTETGRAQNRRVELAKE